MIALDPLPRRDRGVRGPKANVVHFRDTLCESVAARSISRRIPGPPELYHQLIHFPSVGVQFDLLDAMPIVAGGFIGEGAMQYGIEGITGVVAPRLAEFGGVDVG